MNSIGPLIFVILFALGCIVPHIIIACVKAAKKRKEGAELAKIKSSPEYRAIQKALKKAKELAEQKGLSENYSKNQGWIEVAALQFKDNEKLLNASIVYFVYGIHDSLIKRYCFRNSVSEKELSYLVVSVQMERGIRCLEYEEFFNEFQSFAINLIKEFDFSKMEHTKYKKFIVDLCDAKTDKQFFEKIYEYGAEIPERMKAMLNNDKDTLMETLFYSIAVTIEQSKANYVKWNRYTQLNFIIHYYSVLLAGVENTGNNGVIANFKSTFKKHFVYYAKQKGIGGAEAEKFFEERAKIYNDVNIMDEDGASELVDITKAYIIKNMGIMYDSNKEFELTSQVNMLHLAISEQAKPWFEKIALAYEEELLDDEDISAEDLMDLAAQNAFYSISVAIIESNSKYFKKGLPHLDFALYYCFIFREVFLTAEIDEEKKEHFKSKMEQHYVEYALKMGIVESKTEAERLFWKRNAIYNLTHNSYDGNEQTLKTTDALIEFTMKVLELSNDSYVDILEEVGELLAILNDKAKPLYENLLEIYETESFFDSVNSTLEGAIQHLEEYAESIKEDKEEI